ncbi:hypothetical protein [Salinivibrio kushneri]|uniref:hypothetical protein n=1 Tax=Salinivibrio kushneri TaxID=1908198 RepID=UPI0009887C3E|nr:hypothetical protein [Salinivibrio kushneri]OOE33283.1 hypothetical protein BZG04_13750 [Salinivibrio kushneri]OOE50037.1 hypothetical protein BZG12_14965 [Salinivibrio kushneri]WBA12675.1 hypothetical protein O4546_05580 [Salinivibrio kushneri]
MTRLLLAVTLVVSIGITAYLWLDTSGAPPTKMTTEQSIQQPSPDVAEYEPSTPASTPRNAQHRPEEPDIVQTSMAPTLSYIAADYAEQIQHPSYSIPIPSKQSPYLHWNRYVSTPMPILDGSVKAALKLNQYRYFYPENIQASLITPASFNHATVSVIDVEANRELTRLNVTETQWNIEPKADWPIELRLKAALNFDGGDDVLTADFRLYQPIAEVKGVKPVFGRGPDMVIPLVLDIDKSGIYRVRANLFTADDKPVAALTSKTRLSEGEQTLALHAFKAAMRGYGDEWQLKDVVIERMSGYPGERAQFGISPQDYYSLGTFDTGQLSDEPYQMNEQERMQLEFLQRAAQQS